MKFVLKRVEIEAEEIKEVQELVGEKVFVKTAVGRQAYIVSSQPIVVGDFLNVTDLGDIYHMPRRICVGDKAKYETLSDTMTFGLAIEAAKEGAKIARKGWSGKGLYVFYQKGHPEGIPANRIMAEATGLPEGTVCYFRPYLMMKSENNEFVPWSIAMSDVLENDWMIV